MEAAVDKKLETVAPTKAQLKARRSRNLAIAAALAIFVILVYAVTIVKLGPNIMNRF